MSIRITELDAITSLQDGDYVAVDNESAGTHKFKALDISANVAKDIANTYSSSASYAIGQYCLYNNNLYRCTTTISTPEAWNAAHWVQVTVGEGLYDKVDKVSGKALSTNDFTNDYKAKLDGIQAGAEVNVQANWTQSDNTQDDYIKNKPGNATQSVGGFMSADDKTKLDSIASGAEVNVQANWAESDSSKDDYIKNKPTIDEALSLDSDNAVRNSAITAGINQVQNNLDTEITNRQNADNALDGRLDTVEETLPNKANINGSYATMSVGTADQLSSNIYITDQVPYLFRTSGGSVDIGDREEDMLVGGTVAWNQLAITSSTEANVWNPSDNGKGNLVDGKVKVTPTTYTKTYALASPTGAGNIKSHVYFVHYKVSEVSNNVTYCGIKPNYSSLTSGEFTIQGVGSKDYIVKPTATVYFQAGFSCGESNVTSDDYNVFSEFAIIDLTQMFGTAIADYIYSLETATPGAGVAFFRKLFPKPYYAHNAGELMSVKALSHDMTGFNQWDEETADGYWDGDTGIWTASNNWKSCKNHIPCLPNTDYYFNMGTVSSGSLGRVCYYDANKNFISSILSGWGNSVVTTPNNAHYLTFYANPNFFVNNICINISWDGSRNGEYEPYELYSYALDTDLTLRGIPKLDANDSLYYDGDTYESDGTVTRKYGIVDLGTLNYTLSATGLFLTDTIGSLIKAPINSSVVADNVISIYIPVTSNSITGPGGTNPSPNMVMAVNQSGRLYFNNTSYTDATAFKTAMSGVYLVYELATSTTEEATPYASNQVVNDFGTEEYVDDRDVPIPVGHYTKYQANLKAKLEMAPNSPDGDGDYIVRQTNGENAYVPFPSNNIAYRNGYYETLGAGTADNLVTAIRATDLTPYNFRSTGGTLEVANQRYVDKVIGASFTWNQVLKEFNSINWIAESNVTATFNDDGSVSFTSNTASNGIKCSTYASKNKHRYLLLCEAKADADCSILALYGSTAGSSRKLDLTTSYVKYEKIITTGATTAGGTFYFVAYNSATLGHQIDIKAGAMLIDLTQMFGSTIADYIYTLESDTAGAGIAWLRNYGFFTKPWYERNAGGLEHVQCSALKTTGFNQWDEEWEIGGISPTTGEKTTDNTRIRSKNKTPIIPNTQYYLQIPSPNNLRVYFYDADDNYLVDETLVGVAREVITTPANARYLAFIIYNSGYGTTYKHDICISIHWDETRDGDYEEYVEHVYELDGDVVLRGIPKLDANNNLYYNGDEYEPDGMVIRKYGVYTFTGEESLTKLTTTVEGWNQFAYQPSPALANGSTADFITDACQVVGYTTYQSMTSFSAPIAMHYGTGIRFILNYSEVSDAKAWLTGKTLVYPLATPTTEEATSYPRLQACDNWGTEFAVDGATRDVEIPVGFETEYPISLRDKIEASPDNPSSDGLYLLSYESGTASYTQYTGDVRIPAVPTTDGEYKLTVTVADGTPTYTWESVE